MKFPNITNIRYRSWRLPYFDYKIWEFVDRTPSFTKGQPTMSGEGHFLNSQAMWEEILE